jgi:hypothetical protein
MKEMDMLATKIYLLLKKFAERATDINTDTVKALDSHRHLWPRASLGRALHRYNAFHIYFLAFVVFCILTLPCIEN